MQNNMHINMYVVCNIISNNTLYALCQYAEQYAYKYAINMCNMYNMHIWKYAKYAI
jgi:hypothetical protein